MRVLLLGGPKGGDIVDISNPEPELRVMALPRFDATGIESSASTSNVVTVTHLYVALDRATYLYVGLENDYWSKGLPI